MAGPPGTKQLPTPMPSPIVDGDSKGPIATEQDGHQVKTNPKSPGLGTIDLD